MRLHFKRLGIGLGVLAVIIGPFVVAYLLFGKAGPFMTFFGLAFLFLAYGIGTEALGGFDDDHYDGLGPGDWDPTRPE